MCVYTHVFLLLYGSLRHEGVKHAESANVHFVILIIVEDQPRSYTSSPSPTPSASSHHHNPLAGVGKALRRIHSGGSHDYSKLSRKASEPLIKDKKEKKRSSLFKKRQTSHDPIMEYKETRASSNEHGSPLLSSPANRKHVSTIVEYSEEPQAAPPPTVMRLSRPASSPRISRSSDSKGLPGSTSPQVRGGSSKPPVGDSSLRVKRRPPPPPPSFQKTYPRRTGEDADDSEPITMHVTPASPPAVDTPDEDLPPIKSSASMEELFRNLEEFDELGSPSAQNGEEIEGDRSERDFATIPRSELPPPRVEPPKSSTPDRLTVESAAPQKPPRRRSKKQSEPPSTPAPPPPEAVPPLKSTESGQQAEGVVRTGGESPLPQAPPRRRSRKASEKKEENNKESVVQSSPVPPQKSASPQGRDSPLLSRGKASPPVPPKPSPAIPPKPKALSKPIPAWRANLDKPACSSAPVSRTVSPDDQGRLSASARETSVSTDLLSRSPVVMRRTNAVNASLDPEFSDDELEDCTVSGFVNKRLHTSSLNHSCVIECYTWFPVWECLHTCLFPNKYIPLYSGVGHR